MNNIIKNLNSKNKILIVILTLVLVMVIVYVSYSSFTRIQTNDKINNFLNEKVLIVYVYPYAQQDKKESLSELLIKDNNTIIEDNPNLGMKKISNIFDYNLTINNNSQSDNIALFPEDILNPKLIKSKNADKLDLLIKDQNSKSITKQNSTLDQFIQKDFEINIKNNQNQTTIKTYIQSIEPEQNVLPYHTIGIYNDFANNILSSISPRKK